jgi:glutaredoxin 3
MRAVEIYTTPVCPYCAMAKRLLQKKGVRYSEIDVSRDPALREAMIRAADLHRRGACRRQRRPA